MRVSGFCERGSRTHQGQLTNLPISGAQVQRMLCGVCGNSLQRGWQRHSAQLLACKLRTSQCHRDDLELLEESLRYK